MSERPRKDYEGRKGAQKPKTASVSNSRLIDGLCGEPDFKAEIQHFIDEMKGCDDAEDYKYAVAVTAMKFKAAWVDLLDT
jgi:hypothetical protein